MFELFLVLMTLSSPILLIMFVRNYFMYKSEMNQKLLVLQKDRESHTIIATQQRLDILVNRLIVLEKIVTNSNIDLSQEIAQL
ncbi:MULTISPECIES: hypothetical protein [unclassified Colwellia]|uniref:hypothetical protein n=1 Tax=unclassified Colwellia TaxID=196834 RepID=UPI0015F57CCE|nr:MULTISPECIES: hypothetical protein [unclassified Colwellia]MBA6231966.1 hypothetical protein [Colwellia sp. MB02u-7]MBA6235861.1 hypothetical protein [Colwellia sp. MB02u-11]MBA6298724.1 hypothetical protein [Colwellia sp. MB3u-22]MBA6310176.1 hypothetical protein [Colwellia sp. MB3u-64]